MVTYSAGSADPSVVAQAYAAARRYTADPKVLLALFEAGMVESRFHNNTSATDHDSLGYLQQRPSQGWPDPTNIATATHSFIAKAAAKLAADPSLTAGQLAQAVQVSAYPERYDQAQGAAQQLLSSASGGSLAGVVSGIVSAPGDALDALATAIRQTFAPLVSVGSFSEHLTRAFLPSSIVRICAGIGGTTFLIIGIVLLTREARNA